MSVGSKELLKPLKERAALLRALRTAFAERGIMEVDTPILCQSPSVDTHIDLMATKEGRFLHTSPEHGMKRLLASGAGSIYQISHVFRAGEIGPLHNPEFTLIEWYKTDIPFSEFIDDTIAILQIALGPLPLEIITYSDAFLRFGGIDIRQEDLTPHVDADKKTWDRATLLDYLWTHRVEPELGQEGLTVIRNYPLDQAANARIDGGVAMRFEIYYKGIELGNGYHELDDPDEQIQRFREANEKRQALGKEPYPIDNALIDAMWRGFPNCCGVAVGFDRLLMLALGRESISDVLPFPWDIA